MKRTLIVAGGDINSIYLNKCIHENHYDEIIAVDGGLTYLNELQHNPDVIIGDFDTVDKSILDKYKMSNVITLNPIKDSTDTEEALDYAICHGACKIDIIGGMGGRFDHTLGNIFLLKKAYEQRVLATILSEQNEVFIVSDYAKICSKGYKYISFIQFDGPALGVTLKGFKYNVEEFDFDTAKTYRLGISNEMEDEYGEVYIREGCMLCILSKDN